MILLRAKLTERRPLDVSRDAWRTITRESYRAVGAYWVENYLRGHFEPSAWAKYRYQPRSRKYLDRKQMNYAHGTPMAKFRDPVVAGKDTPLVLTGYMKREMLSHVIIRGFPTRCTVIMVGPPYLTTRFYKVRQPDKPKEITTVTDEERKVLGRVLRDEVTKRLNEYRAPRVTE